MTNPTHDWVQISKLLDQALALPPTSRITWLDQLDGQFDNLKPQLRDMLLHQGEIETNSFLSPIGRLSFAPQTTGNSNYIATLELASGANFGPFRLLRPLGEGGMGTVWLAERTDGLIKRAVALKLPHFTLQMKGIAERFAREREILSTLAHPNIAQLFDAGMDVSGQPYLALEYVEGVALTQYCDDKKLTIRARLTLYLQVLAAVQYAHANLVLHRDLKPSNILVNGHGVVKLLDFGIAKLMTDGSAHVTELTQLGGRALTIDYASPEQIMGQPLTTASDVYSLGVLLCELLSGERPYRLKRGTRAELEEAILAADPARPSSLVKNPVQSASRSETIAQLVSQLAGDLDCIVGKALDKDRLRRYASVAMLADDIERHLRGEVVLAQPESRWYRLRKFTARNRILIGAGSSVAVAVVAAMVVSIWQGRIANNERRNAQEVRQFLVDAISSADPNRTGGRDVNIKSMLDSAAKRVETSFGDQLETGLELTTLLGELYATLGDNAAAQKQFRNAVAQSQRNGKTGTLPYADLVDQTVKVELRNNAGKEARSLAESTLNDTRRVSGESSLAFATALAAMANVERHDGKDKDAIPFAERSLEITRALAGSKHIDTLSRLDDLGVTYTDARQDEKALPIFEELRRRDGELNLRSKSTQLNAWASLAFTYIRLMRYEDAIREYAALVPAYEALLGKNHPKVRLNMQRFATILGKVGEFDKARGLFDEALSRGPTIPTTDRSQLDAMNMRGVFLSGMHLHEAALADTSAPANHFRQSPNLPAGPRLYYELLHGQTLLRAGHLEAAIDVLNRVRKDREEKQNVLSFEYAATLISLSCAYRILGQYEQAQSLLSRAQTWLDTDKIPADDHRALRIAMYQAMLDSHTRKADALARFLAARQKFEPKLHPKSLARAELDWAEGELRLNLGEQSAGERLVADAKRRIKAVSSLEPPRQFALIQAT